MAIQAEFEKMYKLTLFAKASHNLIAMNAGGNSPYVVPSQFVGVSVGIKFQKDKGETKENAPAVEVYIRNNLMDSAGGIYANSVFDELANTFRSNGVEKSETSQNGFEMTKFLVRIENVDSDIKAACKLMYELCEGLDGTLKRT